MFATPLWKSGKPGLVSHIGFHTLYFSFNTVFNAVPFSKANGITLGTIKNWVNPFVCNSVPIAENRTIP